MGLDCNHNWIRYHRSIPNIEHSDSPSYAWVCTKCGAIDFSTNQDIPPTDSPNDDDYLEVYREKLSNVMDILSEAYRVCNLDDLSLWLESRKTSIKSGSNVEKLNAYLNLALECAKNDFASSREMSLVKTKIEEAQLWLMKSINPNGKRD